MHPECLFLTSLLALGFASFVAPAKILLLFPIPFPSHWKAFSPLFEELASRGHQITAYTTIKGLKSYTNFEHTTITADSSKTNLSELNPVTCRSRSVAACVLSELKTFYSLNEAALKSKELQSLMHSEEKFDLILTEVFYAESILGFGHKFGVPVVGFYPDFLSPSMAHLSGIPHSFSYIPIVLKPFTDRMSFWQRTDNAVTGILEILGVNFYYLPYQERIMRRHFKHPGAENMPPLKEMISNISLLLVNSHPVMGYTRPYAPHVVDIAGINIKPAGKLHQDLLTFLDGATDGFIYVSFASFVDPKSFSQRFQNVLIETLKGVKWRVVMKSGENYEGAPHILKRPRLPQLEVISHPKCKLFITHGGFNSMMEAMSVGVPTLGLPFFADQWKNVEWYKQRGVGLDINYETDTVRDLTEKINRIIGSPSFMENAKRIAAIYRDPRSKLDNAVFWVEYVIRHKGAHHLKPASVKMPYYQYLLLDVVAFLALSFFLTFYTLYYITRRVMHLFKSKNSVSNAKKRT